MATQAKARTDASRRNRTQKKKAQEPPKKQPQRRVPQADDLVFALDIGTRTIIGIVGRRLADGALQVLDFEQMEHPGRAMMDGQVEDIAQVGRLVSEVKKRLEERLGIALTRVSLAAAGRMLRTVQVRAARELPGPHGLADRDAVLGLEGEAIELAQAQVKDERRDGSGYYCVGYSIVEYCMDGQPVSQLVGHTCSEISVEMIAAFLPYSVVEGLYAAVDMNELEVMSLTLEPIAAINVLIPRELRLLNLALVDVGAGTSDIAICRDGKIASYEMATIAGDELTETVIRKYLVDFATAEQLKRSLSDGATALEYQNILGLAATVSAEELTAVLAPTVEHLAETVAEKILSCNGEPPAAVFLIGGGSQAAGLGKALANALGIPEGNVSVGTKRTLKGVDIAGFSPLTGPEFVTPLGIAVTAITQECFHFFGVSINGRRLKLLNTSHMRMMDVLLMAGYKSSQIIGRSGRSILFSLNGSPRTVRGGLPEHATILLNGAPAGIDADVRPGDMIEITPAANGAPAEAYIGDFLPEQGALSVMCNGKPADAAAPIHAGDVVVIVPAPAPEEPAPKEAAPVPAAPEPPAPARAEAPPAPAAPAPAPAASAPAPAMPEPAAAHSPESPSPVTGTPKPRPAAPAAPKPAPRKEEPAEAAPVRMLNIVLNGDPITLPLTDEQNEYFMMHLLEIAGVDPDHPEGKLILQCDGRPVGFMHKLRPGALVTIRWE